MAKTPKQLDEFLKPLRDEDVSTLRALDHKLHLLLEQRSKIDQPPRRLTVDQDEISAHCPGVKIDPDLLALVGIHPENPVKEDKILIRESIARRLTD